MSTRLERRVVRKTANYTITPPTDAPGTMFTNGGAGGTVIFTLPTPNKAMLGVWYEFAGLVNQLITVSAPVADTLIVFNDAAADTISLGGSGQRIGGVIRVICVETAAGAYAWLAEYGSQGITFAAAT